MVTIVLMTITERLPGFGYGVPSLLPRGTLTSWERYVDRDYGGGNPLYGSIVARSVIRKIRDAWMRG